MNFHHCMPLEYVAFKEIVADPSFSCQDFVDDEVIFNYEMMANRWLQEKCGFYPHFCAVGTKQDDLYMTGYDFQFKRVIGWGPQGKIYQKPSDINSILFTFDHLEGVFMDYQAWFCVLNGEVVGEKLAIPDYVTRSVFKPSWPRSKWMKASETKSVMFVTPKLDLPNASLIRVRNKETKKKLEKMGFDGNKIEVFHLHVCR